jgi:hypothetical protein
MIIQEKRWPKYARWRKAYLGRRVLGSSRADEDKTQRPVGSRTTSGAWSKDQQLER